MDKTISLGSVKGIITPPSSKSYAQRAIALALMAKGRTAYLKIHKKRNRSNVMRADEYTKIVKGMPFA